MWIIYLNVVVLTWWCVCGKVGGVLVMPLNDNLVQIKRNGVDEWSSRNLLNVSFATLKIPTHEEAGDIIKLGKTLSVASGK